MPRPRQLDPSALTLRLQTQGPLAAQDLADGAGVVRSRVSQVLTELGDPIVRLGATRGMRYALRRTVRGVGHTFSVRRIDATGRAEDWAELTALHGGWRVAWANENRVPAWAGHVLGLGGWSEGFPFFLSDLRPQGYLGRLVGRNLPTALGLPADPRDWSDDHTLIYLQAEGDDVAGDLVVGDQPLQRVQRRQVDGSEVGIADPERRVRYPELAENLSAMGRGGSSVEGEQPKFLTVVEMPDGRRPVVVKFTDLLSTPTGRRWADLAAAEMHALAILHEQGEAQAVPRVLDAGGRRFFETPRFDRIGLHGRRGVVSLRALHDALPGPDTSSWVECAQAFEREGLIAADTLRAIRRRHAFGQLIGNSDMHFGNLAFWRGDALPFELAPAYDMLPMLWAPTAGNATPSPEFAPPPPLPAERELWSEAAAWAAEFWRRVCADESVSPEFVAIGQAAGATVARLREHFGARRE